MLGPLGCWLVPDRSIRRAAQSHTSTAAAGKRTWRRLKSPSVASLEKKGVASAVLPNPIIIKTALLIPSVMTEIFLARGPSKTAHNGNMYLAHPLILGCECSVQLASDTVQ